MINEVVNDTYEKLVEAVRNSYLSLSGTKIAKHLQWCSQGKAQIECNEINLWTYWQGRNRSNTRVLLVGQDWGCVDEEISAPCVRNVELMNQGKNVQYLEGVEKKFPTDKHLCELFKVFSEYTDIEHVSYSDLFFTNFVLGYRTSGISGGEKKSWFEKDRQHFYDLVMLLRPKVIICLGKVVYEEVVKTFTNVLPDYQALDFWQMLDYGSNCQMIEKEEKDLRCMVYGVAHCGGMGVANRKKFSKYKEKTGKDLQREDWKKICDYMKKEGI